MAEKDCMPEIRFEGFDDEWEQRKLGDVVDVCSGKDYKHLDEGDIPVYGTGGYMTSVSEALSYSDDAIGIGRKGTIDNPLILRAPFWTVDTLFYSIPKPAADLDFVFGLFLNINWKKKDESTGLPSLSKQAIVATKVACPSLSEQRLIGAFFRNLDNLITLHQRKHEKLRKAKAALLEKMFPKLGETEPEIRFPGFTGPWEQRKWSDCVLISTEMVDPKTGLFDDLPHVGPGNIESFTGRLYDNVKTVKEDALISGKFHFYPGDVIYGKINPQLGKYVFAQFEGLASADVYVLNGQDSLDQKFLFSLLQTKRFFDYSVSVSMRSGMPKINRNELGAYTFLTPGLQEQNAIGSLMLSLDSLITLHQRKLEMLRKVKKSLLEKMFA